MAFFPLGQQANEYLRWVLEVGVHHARHVAARVAQSRRHRRLMTEVARQVDALEAWILAVHAVDDAGRLVRRAVVHEDHFETGIHLFERGHEAPPEFSQHVHFVEDRNDDRYARVPRRSSGGVWRRCMQRVDFQEPVESECKCQIVKSFTEKSETRRAGEQLLKTMRMVGVRPA